jgi:hypothetical protein
MVFVARKNLQCCSPGMSANLIVLSLMSALDPIQYEIDDLSYDIFDRPTRSYGHCDYAESKGFLITLAVINLGILVLALYQAWHARTLSTEFAESKLVPI